MSDIRTRRGELFYWTAILVSNTLGTALGDYLADTSGLGFGTRGSSLLLLVVLVGLVMYTTWRPEPPSLASGSERAPLPRP